MNALLLTCAAVALGFGSTACGGPDAGATPRTVLAVRDAAFLINGEPKFLYGFSYYGALGGSAAALKADLDQAERYGFNWIRVWANWSAFGHDVAGVEADGRPREPYLTRLRALVEECDRRGLIVDVTLTRAAVGEPARLSSLAAHRRAIESLMTALRAHRNWYLDLANERNVHDGRFVSFEELRELRELVRRLDPGRLVTASHSGDIGADELAKYLEVARVDFLAPHRSRHEGSAGETARATFELLTAMRARGHIVPVHYQEPFRRGYARWQPKAGDFVGDFLAARESGAAGWCFHNGSERDGEDGRPRARFRWSRGRCSPGSTRWSVRP